MVAILKTLLLSVASDRDILFPYLFILTLGTLSKAILKFQECCMYDPIHFGASRNIQISHALCANDSILFCEASLSQWGNIDLLLHYVHTWTGLSINAYKSSIFFSSNVPNALINNILALSNLSLMPEDALYLRNPLSPLKGRARLTTSLPPGGAPSSQKWDVLS